MSRLQNKKFLYVISGFESSSFVRAMVYKEEYIKRGIHVDYFQLNSKALVKILEKVYSFYPAQLMLRALKKLYYYQRRFFLLRCISKYDVIIAVKYIESDLLKQIKSQCSAILIYDFDDAIWLDLFCGENEFSKKISAADCITSDNSFLANHASLYNKNSYILNGPCQIEKFLQFKNNSTLKNLKSEPTVTIGWVGSPSTLFYLFKIYDALEIIGERFPNVILKLIGTGHERLLVPFFEKIKVVSIPTYDQNEMIKQVYSFDIGLYPLFFNELSLGRGSLKATIYMAGSIPVVCSAIGENVTIIQNGINGFLASDKDEWVEKLSLLIENPTLRKEIGENGFNFAEAKYSITSCLKQCLDIVEKQTLKNA